MKNLIQWGGKHRVLIADDEPDVHAVTKLSLKALSRKCGPVEFLSAHSGKQALELLEQYPDIGLILLDVVMESDRAGLDVCQAIRNDLGNSLVRILMRTGQPGIAPEQQTIDTYDIDGYLAKSETSASRLYTAARCALKSYQELVTLERHRAYLTAVSDCSMALNADMSSERMLTMVLSTTLSICPAPLVALDLETFEQSQGTRRTFLHLGSGGTPTENALAAEAARMRIQGVLATQRITGPTVLDNGFLIPLELHRELGYGWLYLDAFTPDELAKKTLTLLAGHAQNAIYASLALSALRDRKSTVFDEISI
ncbi:MAG: response regulator [Polyangiaceae bacterium]